MAAGLSTLCTLRDNREIYSRMDRLVGSLVAMVQDAAKEAGVPVAANRVGSMFTWFFTDHPVKDWETASKCDTAAFGRFHHAMLDAGIYLPPSQFEAAFFSAAHTEEDVSQTVAAAREAFALVGA
jgi:glutamate-1-semialdehyde 2,1-aminomutase